MLTNSPTAPLLVRIPRDIEKPLGTVELKATETLELEFEIPDALVWDGQVEPALPDKVAKQELPARRESPDERKASAVPVVARPHIGWFVFAFCLMSLLVLYCNARCGKPVVGTAGNSRP